MQNFYVVYDGTETYEDGTEKLRVGISTQGAAMNHLIIYVLAGVCVVLILIVSVIAIFHTITTRSDRKKESQIKLFEAKRRLEQMNENEDEEEETNLASASLN